MREIAWIEREGGVDQFEFEFEIEFGSTTQLSSRGGVDRFEFEFGSTTIIELGGVDRFELEFEFDFGSTTIRAGRGWTSSSSRSSSDRRLRDL